MHPEKMNIGYLAEERGLYPKYTLLDQLLYFAKLKGVPRHKAMEKIKYWSKRLQLDEYIFPTKRIKAAGMAAKKNADSDGYRTVPAKSMRAEQLSKGNQQKVQLMAALLSDPEFVILDEPMSGLDPVNTDLFKEVIRDEISKDKYVIMSSHQMPTIEEFCSDITIMNRGNVVLQGNLNEIKKSYGRVNLFVKCEQPIDQFIKAAGLTVVEETPAEIQLRVTGEEQAMAFLNTLIMNKVTVIRFDLREPSLHEIFVEKVGAGNEEQ
jgi:ABC-2 type transport system ATP-binding protein